MRLRHKTRGEIVDKVFTKVFTDVMLSDGTPILVGYTTWQSNDRYIYGDIGLYYPEFAWEEIPDVNE